MKFRVLSISTVIVLLFTFVAHHYIPSVPLWYVGVVLWAYVTLVFVGCVKLSTNFFIPVRCKADTKEKVVALTFDDGPNATYGVQVLDTLKAYNVPAAFFCIGKHIAGNEAILRRMNEEGHIIGNHSFSHHFWFDLFGAKKMLADLQQMDAATKAVVGKTPILFRPPYGVMNPNMAKAIKNGGYALIGWSIRSFDTTAKDKEKLLSRITTQVKPGDIILLHDSMQITAAILSQLIEQLHNKGYKIVRADKLLNIEAYA